MNKDTIEEQDNVIKRTRESDETTTRRTADVPVDRNIKERTHKTSDQDKTKDVKEKPVLNDNMMLTLGLLGSLGLIFLLYFTFGNKKPKEFTVNEESFIDKFNEKKNEYSLKVNKFFHNMSLSDLTNYFKPSLSDNIYKPLCDTTKLQSVTVPQHYNFFDKNSHCRFQDVPQKTVSGYVEVLASVIRNRNCLVNKDKTFMPSTDHLLNCDKALHPNKVGFLSSVLDYVKKNGIISQKCYSGLKIEKGKCVSDADVKKCDKIEIDDFCFLDNATNIKKEIIQNGPVISIMEPFQNFLLYEKGLYDIDGSKKLEGKVFVKVVGWGVDHKKNEYWLVESTWGPEWGEKGLAKVKMNISGSYLDSTAVVVNLKTPEIKTEKK